MRFRHLLFISVLFSPVEEVETWTPCMPFCDTMCTGVAAVNLSAVAASSYASLNTSIASEGSAIVDLNNALISQLSSLYSTKTVNSQRRITAFDGLAKKVTAKTAVSGITNVRLTDHFVSQLVVLKKSLRSSQIDIDGASITEMTKVVTANKSIAAIPQIREATQLNKKRVREAIIYQVAKTKQIGRNNIASQRQALIKDIDFDLPNPFTSTTIEMANWKSYQDFLFLTFNFKPFTELKTVNDRSEYLKRQLALNTISEALSDKVIIEDNGDDLPALYASNDEPVLRSALYEQYKQLLVDVNTQTNTKAISKKPLLTMINLQLAQKNFLLSEILKIKKQKNVLLVLSKT